MTKLVAVIGSTRFPLAEGAGYILKQMTTLNPGDEVIVRGANVIGKAGVPLRGVDSLATVFARALKLTHFPVPLPRATNPSFERANTLANISDEVWAFFAPDQVMEGGTAVVVSLAQSKGKRVRAWTVEDGKLVEVGDD